MTDGKTITQLPYAFGLCQFSCLNTFQPCLDYLANVLKVEPTSLGHTHNADVEGLLCNYHLTFEQATELSHWLTKNGY